VTTDRTTPARPDVWFQPEAQPDPTFHLLSPPPRPKPDTTLPRPGRALPQADTAFPRTGTARARADAAWSRADSAWPRPEPRPHPRAQTPAWSLSEPEQEEEPTLSGPGGPIPVSPSPGDPGTAPSEPWPMPNEPSTAPSEPWPMPNEPSPTPREPDLTPRETDPTPAEPPSRPGTASEAGSTPAARPTARPAEAGEWRGIVLITGTDVEVGKSVVTSAIVVAAQAAGLRVAVVKPGQTGTARGGLTDTELITRLAAPHTCRTMASYPEALAPLTAARIGGVEPLELYEVVDAVRAEAEKHDLVLVEGAGGLLVPMGVRPSGDAWTMADLATSLGAPAIVVTHAGQGTLNHTALTLEALARRGVPTKMVLGAWPAEPQLVHWANLTELVPELIGALPADAGRMDPGVFHRSAPGWLTPALYGVLDDWRVWAEEAG
jgi:dethiobiotin synthetase